MGYRSVVISSAVHISVKNRQLIISGEATGSIPVEDIRTLMIESRATTITAYALSELSENGVCVYLCDEKHLPSAVLQSFCRYSRQRKQLTLQLEQSKPATKRMWRDIVVSKITNQAKCLELCGVNEEQVKKVSILILVGKLKSEEQTSPDEQLSFF